MENIDLQELATKFQKSETQRLEESAAAQLRDQAEALRAQTHNDRLDRILAGQTAADVRRETNRRLVLRVGGPLVVALLGGGGTVGWQTIAAPPTVESKEVQQTVVEKSDAVETRVETVEKRQNALGHEAVNQHILITDTHSDLQNRLNAMSDESRKVEEPDSIQDARDKSTRMQKQISVSKLFGDIEDVDPFKLLSPEK